MKEKRKRHPGRPKRNGPWPKCKVEECTKTIQGGSRGFCHTHYVAARRGRYDMKTGAELRPSLRVTSYGDNARCRVDGCLSRPKGDGLCSAHWQRRKNGLPLSGPVRPRAGVEFVECMMEGCERRSASRGMCQRHAEQRNRGILSSEGVKLRDPLPGGRPRKERHVRDGYVLIWAPKDHPSAQKSGLIYEHRLVMERNIGRHLEEWEIVHHKNGNPSDNRIENLELMDGRAKKGSGHPPGHELDKEAAVQALLQDKNIPVRLRRELEKLK